MTVTWLHNHVGIHNLHTQFYYRRRCDVVPLQSSLKLRLMTIMVVTHARITVHVHISYRLNHFKLGSVFFFKGFHKHSVPRFQEGSFHPPDGKLAEMEKLAQSQ